jgi:hypothetical protein
MRRSGFASHPRAGLILDIMRVHRREVRFLIEPRGPTRFILRQVVGSCVSPTPFAVSLGFSQRCSCTSRDICVHIIYVMMRFFGVPKDSDLLWQKSLTNQQITSLLEGRGIFQHPRRHPPPHPPSSSPVIRPRNKVHRLAITEEDLCPICYDTMTTSEPEEVAWCSYGCGGNFHLECVQAWIDSKAAEGECGSCPICRIQITVPDTSAAFEETGEVREYRPQPAEIREYRSQPVDQETQIAFAELESYLESARMNLNREFARVEAQQRRITEMIETHDKARQDLQLRISKQFGRTAAPRLPLRMPELFPAQPRRVNVENGPPFLPRMIGTETIVESQPSGESVQRIEIRRTEPEEVRPTPQLIQREGNISDALSLTQVRIEAEKARMSLTSQLTLRIPKKQRALGPRKGDLREESRPITACIGWSV